MTDPSSRGLLIAVLIVSSLNLLATAVQTGLLLKQPTGGTAVAAGASQTLPAKFTEPVLAAIANRVITPYNHGDSDALYDTFDDLAKAQLTRDKIKKQSEKLTELVGRVDSASYVGFQRNQKNGRLDTYELTYVVKLSGAQFSGGTLTVTVVDRDSGPGIIGFFLNGSTQ